MAKPTKHVYRKGDKVRILEPLLFERVGYPLSLASAIDHVRSKHAKDINALADAISHHPDDPPSEPLVTWVERAPDENLVKAAAYVWLCEQGFGGKERRIHTATDEALRGRKAVVLGKRMVKTGDYSHGHDRYTDDGIPDFDLPHLANEKSHVILELEVLRPRTVSLLEPGIWEEVGLFEIEECHVEPAGFDLNEALTLMAQRSRSRVLP